MFQSIGKFIVRSAVHAAGFFALWLLLIPLIGPAGSDTRTGLLTAVIWGPLMVLFRDVTTRREAAGQDPVSSKMVIGVGLVCLAMYAWFGLFSSPRPVGSELWWLIGLAVPPLCLIVCGILMIRRGPKQSPKGRTPN